MEKIGYYVNDKFCLDDRIPAGINVMLYKGEELNYWFEEYRCKTWKEVYSFINDYTVNNEKPEMIRKTTTYVDPKNMVGTVELEKNE